MKATRVVFAAKSTAMCCVLCRGRGYDENDLICHVCHGVGELVSEREFRANAQLLFGGAGEISHAKIGARFTATRKAASSFSTAFHYCFV